jgi:hypothetical protein
MSTTGVMKNTQRTIRPSSLSLPSFSACFLSTATKSPAGPNNKQGVVCPPFVCNWKLCAYVCAAMLRSTHASLLDLISVTDIMVLYSSVNHLINHFISFFGESTQIVRHNRRQAKSSPDFSGAEKRIETHTCFFVRKYRLGGGVSRM